MSTAWRYTAMILAGSLLLLAAGLFTVCSAVAGSRGLQEMQEVRKTIREMGGQPGLAARKARLAEILARLKEERAAQGADAAAFSRRIEEVFAGLGLALTASSEWRPVPKVEIPGAAAFERTFAGAGRFDHLLDAVAILESWPDGVRVRALSVTRQAPGTVAFSLEITAVRSGRLDSKAPPTWQSFIRPDRREAPPRPVVRFAEGLPSPFDRLPAAAGKVRTETVAVGGPGLRVEGISFGANAVALLSGQAVRVGDTISGHRVVRIDRSAVTLLGPGGRLELGFQ